MISEDSTMTFRQDSVDSSTVTEQQVVETNTTGETPPSDASTSDTISTDKSTTTVNGKEYKVESVEDKAASDYHHLLPELFKIVDLLPKKQILRVFKAILEYPLENDKPKLSYEAERKAFYYGMHIQDCRFVLIKAVHELMKNKEELNKFKEQIILQEELKRAKGEPRNDL